MGKPRRHVPVDSPSDPAARRRASGTRTRTVSPPARTARPGPRPDPREETATPVDRNAETLPAPPLALPQDDVGDAASLLAEVRERVVRSGARRDDVTRAPIDHRDAFLLSHVEGLTSVQALVDVTGMPEAEVTAILERLARLGILTNG